MAQLRRHKGTLLAPQALAAPRRHHAPEAHPSVGRAGDRLMQMPRAHVQWRHVRRPRLLMTVRLSLTQCHRALHLTNVHCKRHWTYSAQCAGSV